MECAEIPKVVRLNYANLETLAERLNAMFNEEGTSATIRLSDHGLSNYSMEDGLPVGRRRQHRQSERRRRQPQRDRGRRVPALVDHRPPARDQRNTPISNIIGRAVHPGEPQPVHPGSVASGVHGGDRGDDRRSGRAPAGRSCSRPSSCRWTTRT